MAERESLLRDYVMSAGGMAVVDGEVTEDERLYYARGVSSIRPGQLSRQNGKIAGGNAGTPIMGFSQFFSPRGYITTITQTGYTFNASGTDGSTAGGSTPFWNPSPIPVPQTLGLPNSPYISGGIVSGVSVPLSNTTIDYGIPGGGPVSGGGSGSRPSSECTGFSFGPISIPADVCACNQVPYGTTTYQNPFPFNASVTITGFVDDVLLINGAFCAGGPLDPPCCNNAGSITYTFNVGPSESFTVAVGDNHGIKVEASLTICFTQI